MWRRTGPVAALIIVLAAIGRGVLEPAQDEPTEYFVSPDGDNGNAGTFESPWRTVAYGVTALSPGDVLHLRGGTYYEHEIGLSVAGTENAPITIQSYPGEQAIIDGGVPDFRTMQGSAWEIVDDSIGLYRSQQIFPQETDFVRAWLVADDVQLVEYESQENLASTNYGPLNGLAPFYMGPGLRLGEDGHLYIRLQYNPNDLTDFAGNPIEPKPVETNPNNNEIAVFFSRHIFRMEGASHVRLRDIDFSHAVYIFDVRLDSNNVILSGCRLNFGNRGLVIRGGVRNWEIHDCEFNNGVPDYVYWTDVKNRGREVTEAHPEFQSVAISGSLPGFWVHDNLFRDTFDGLMVGDGTTNARFTNNVFIDVRDDAINLSRGIGEVEVAGNMLWHVKSGISNLSSNVGPGHVYIHHNVIDNSAYQRGGRPGNYREHNWPVWTIGTPFPDHDSGQKDSWWKLYNNTIVTRQNVGHRWAAAGPDSVSGNPEKYVLNNLFYVLDDRVIFRDDLASLGSHYEGNVFFQTADDGLPLFANFGDGGTYESLSDFQMKRGAVWETSALEVDPDLDIEALIAAPFEPQTVWERYRPGNPALFTPGASYEGATWPGTEGVAYRGALSPP